ncbi:MAG: hypothetical protein ACOCTR_06315 [Candidatus Natronoplasma sp.]
MIKRSNSWIDNMLPLWLEVFGSFVVVIISFVYIMKHVVEYKVGKDIWDTYRDVSNETELEVRKSLNVFSNWPDLHGTADGKKVYVHPHKGSKRKNRPAKTIFGVESDIDVEGDLIVVPSTTELSPDSYEYGLDVPNLNKRKYDVYSQSKLNEKIADKIFTKEVTGKIHDLVQKDQEDFRALILEPGLVMFSQYGLELDAGEAPEKLKVLSNLVGAMEESVDSEGSNEDFVNLRIEKLDKKSRVGTVKTIFSCILLGVSFYFLYQLMQGFSFLFMNIGIFGLAIGVLNLYILAYIRLRYG